MSTNIKREGFGSEILVAADPHPVIVWIDVETTGLDPSFDQLLEVAAVITNSGLRPLASYTAVLHHPELVSMAPVVYEMHSRSGLIDEVLNGGMLLPQVYEELTHLLEQFGANKESPIAGSSVGFDKAFLKRDMPGIIKMLHHRVIDVSTLKELVKRWAPQHEWSKLDAHRALPDIHDSINELRHYRLAFGLGW